MTNALGLYDNTPHPKWHFPNARLCDFLCTMTAPTRFSRENKHSVNPFEKYSLTRVINACGKMTALSGAIVLPEIREAAAESMKHFFVLDELQAAAGCVIAKTTGAESGCVTACTAAGITKGTANPDKVAE